MKHFEEPDIHVIAFAVEDIVAASVADNMGDWVGLDIPEIE